MSADEIKDRTVYMLCRTDKTEDDWTDIYIGSTSQPLWRRLCEHRYRAKNFIGRGYSDNNKLYTRIISVGIRKWQIIPLLTFACNQKTIFEFEKEWVRTTGADFNMYSPIREEVSMEEYKANWNKNYYKKPGKG